jgi:kynurenine formamidase
MRFHLEFEGKQYEGLLNEGIDISIPFTNDPESTRAWYLPPVDIEPVVLGDWRGEVRSDGKGVNFNWIRLAPHAHGTHTECLGHISLNKESVNQTMERSHFTALLVSVRPEEWEGDLRISLDRFLEALDGREIPEALVIRTIPNTEDKRTRQYSGSNPPYLDASIAIFLAENGVEHLVLDLPSPDKEDDGGSLSFHHAYWMYPDDPRYEATITELAFIPSEVDDGLYLLEIQLAPLENNAAPSRPVLYPLIRRE